MAENQQSKSKRDLFGERLKNKYPDKEYQDDEALFAQIDDDYNDYEERIGKYKESEDKLNDMFAKNPRSAQFFIDIANGENPVVSMVRRYGIDAMTDLINDPEKQEEFAKANKEFMERIAREKTLDDEYKKNIAESMSMVEQMKTERGLTDETIDAALDFIIKIANETIIGKFTPETVDMALKAINHDSDVDNARVEGELAGKNAKIEETLRKPNEGDGMPAMGGSSAAPTRKKKGFFDDLPQRKF